MAIRPTSLPKWATSVSVVEPSLGKKLVGWLNGERVPAAMLNWLQRNLSEWVVWLLGSSRVLPWYQAVSIANTVGTYNSVALLDSLTTFSVMAISTISSVLAVRISTNAGLNWTATTLAGGYTAATFGATSLAANSVRFVLVGAGGRIQTYESGAWTARTAAAGFVGQFYQVIWNGTQFVAVGDFEVQTSLDGISWTRRASSAPTGGPNPVLNLRSVAAAGGRLVRVGGGGTGSPPTAEIWYSDDGGTTWTWAFSSSTHAYFSGVVGTVFPDGSIGFVTGGESRGAVSAGGAVWTEVQFGGGGTNGPAYAGFAAYNDLLVAGSGTYASPDGTNWYLLPFSYADPTASITGALVSRAGFALIIRPSGANQELARTAPQRWF